MGTGFALDERTTRYLHAMGLREHPVMKKCREETAAMGNLAQMQIAPEQGAFLHMITHLTRAERALEVGTFTGYSALAVALALPGHGRLTALEQDEGFAAQAKDYWREAGVLEKIDLRLAPAAQTLTRLREQEGRQGTYDFAFIDADKGGYDFYYEAALDLIRPGGLIAIDNVLWQGRVADPADQDKATVAIRALNEKISRDRRVDICLLPIGDGLFLCRKTARGG